MRDLYRRLDEAVQSRGPTCWVSGRCCKFEGFGHLLYVTGLEIAWVVRQTLPRLADIPSSVDTALPLADGCVYQVGGLCSVHAVRPLGCRIFFCQAGTQDWQQTLYEDFLAELRRLHDRLGVEYRYMEWRAGLRAVNAVAMRDHR